MAILAEHQHDTMANALRTSVEADANGDNDELIATIRRLTSSVTIHARSGERGFTL